ncbi:MAG: YciI family protein [Deltaproteobacteria bacterium]|nr:YciI family protein [Deltaproteobacteria bacterium]
MRFLITCAPDPKAVKPAADAPFDPALLAAYMRFNEEMFKAGVIVASEGLSPTGQGARVGIAGGKRVVLDGPFTESKELVGGFYLIDVASREEAIAWALRSPLGFGSDDILTIHQLTGADDLPPEIMKIIKEAAPTWSESFEKRKI